MIWPNNGVTVKRVMGLKRPDPVRSRLTTRKRRISPGARGPPPRAWPTSWRQTGMWGRIRTAPIFFVRVGRPNDYQTGSCSLSYAMTPARSRRTVKIIPIRKGKRANKWHYKGISVIIKHPTEGAFQRALSEGRRRSGARKRRRGRQITSAVDPVRPRHL